MKASTVQPPITSAASRAARGDDDEKTAKRRARSGGTSQGPESHACGAAQRDYLVVCYINIMDAERKVEISDKSDSFGSCEMFLIGKSAPKQDQEGDSSACDADADGDRSRCVMCA